MARNHRKQRKAAGPGHHLHRRGIKAGLPPGTPVFVGERKQDQVRVDILHYTREQLQERREVTLKECRPPAPGEGNRWIDIHGVHDVAAVEEIGARFGLHPLTLEDIVNTGQRPKAEEFDDYIFLVLKMIDFDQQKGTVVIENVSLVLGENYVLSFQERTGDVFDPVRQRIRGGKGRMRGSGPDYLAYALMDAVLDGYFVALEKIGDHIEELDDVILKRPDNSVMDRIHLLKRELLFLRKSVWPLREEISLLEKSDSPLIRPATRTFLRDIYDHSIQAIDIIETYRDILGGMHDTYLSSISNRMNEVMKVLTIIATIFIPLTFIAGIYGMNFQYMPELEWRYGYFFVMGFMGLIGVGLLAYFRRREWL